jgi:phage-related tail fiber protein
MARKMLNGIDLNGQRGQNFADPSAANDAATKSYVDNLAAGLAWKPVVRAATTANVTLSGTQTIDGVALVASDRVLVKDQSTASGNGIYVVAAGAWVRATDADSAAELVNATVLVSEGTTNADKAWTQTVNAPITVGTTGLTFAQFGGGGALATAASPSSGTSMEANASVGVRKWLIYPSLESTRPMCRQS